MKMVEDVQAAIRPIASLISKSEKAHQKLVPGTWQHAMLRDNLEALRIALTLMNGEAINRNCVTLDGLQKALVVLASMANKTGKALAKFPPGTPQHSLQQNRLKALHMAEALLKREFTKLQSPGRVLRQ